LDLGIIICENELKMLYFEKCLGREMVMKNLILMSAFTVFFASASFAERPMQNDNENDYRWSLHKELKKQHSENEVLDRYPNGDSTENF